LEQQQENAATQDFVVIATSNLEGQCKIDRFEVLLSITTIWF
jgi:hypothetical protein